jgi:3-deoxy-D-manno-octulosonate 8-phosphate phosphatase (KDO 8-P phosphatase)
MLSTICKRFRVKPSNIAYIGDDVNDIKIMKLVGLSAVPSNGTKEAKSVSDFKCKTNGGAGAFREFSDLISSSKK